jgi:hypothetical protein
VKPWPGSRRHPHPGSANQKACQTRKNPRKRDPTALFFSQHAIHLSNIEATFQHETHCSNMKTHCSNMSTQRAHVSEQDNLENCELQFSNEKACFCRCNILFTGYAFRITKQQKEEKKWQTQKNFLK